jgi:hypothetical protein
MSSTYEPIATTTVPSNTNNVNFTSIPSTYTDLRIVFNGAVDVGQTLGLQFNGDTTTNYSYTRILASTSAQGSFRESSISQGRVAALRATSASSPDPVLIDVLNYTNTTTFKTTISRGSSRVFIGAYVMLWRKTPEAINSIKFLLEDNGDILAGTNITIYGIKAE